MSAVIFAVVIGAIILLVRFYLKWRKRSYMFSLLPGPKYHHPVFGDLPLIIGRSKTSGQSFHVLFLQTLMGLSHIHRKEGLFRVWLAYDPFIFAYSAETVEPILTSQTLLTKGESYDLLHCWLGTGLLTSTGQKWKGRRKLLTPTFHYRILDDFIPIFDEHCKMFVKNISKIASKGPLDIVPHISLLALDAICETAMGTNVGAQKAEAAEYIDAISVFGDILMKRAVKPWLQNEFVLSCTSDGEKFKKTIKLLHEFSSKIIKQRKEELLATIEGNSTRGIEPQEDSLGRKKRQAFLDLLLQTQLKDNSITDEGIYEEVDTFMFEGHDTTATGISWALYHLGRHPEIQQKVYDELQRIFGDDKDREVTSQDLREMKYLECVIKESQRLTPSVPSISRIATEDLNIKGYTIPRGSTIELFIYSLHRDPAVFPDPEVFDPDRFLPENCVGRHPFAYVPFSAGSRNCIGQKFAMMEMKIILCNALRNFIFESVDPLDIIQMTELLVLRPVGGLRMKITERE